MFVRSGAILLILGQSLAQNTAGSFTSLSFNVAGLPPILNGNEVPGDKTTNTARIGQLFSQYNYSLIHVQEDFNFHAALYEHDDHPYRTPTSGGVPFGSGLNTLSNFPYTSFQRVKWNECSNVDSADCLTPKGFTFMRVNVAPGISVDAYNLHADAGTTAADLKARASNLRQVSDFIKTNSVGNSVLVFGDSNTRYTRSGDIPTVFATENGMKDPWVELVRGNTAPQPGTDALLCSNPSTTTACETVDKVWYRGSPAVTLQATSFEYASNKFLQEDGNILSDHNPVLVNFNWKSSPQWRVSSTFGSESGGWYNDLPLLANVQKPTVSSVTLQGANRLDRVSLSLASGETFSHGGTGGTASTLTLGTNEKLVSATLCKGQRNGNTRIFYAELRTSGSKSVASGVKTSDCVDYNAPAGFSIVGSLGNSGDEVDSLGFIYAAI
ncbi:hypothetical protein BU24DRAFT_361442, partial [Aaosphaeria arxii CBS 175.79]